MSDLISREEFIKRIEPYNTDDKMDKALYNFAYNKMMDCSSVEPERKTGKWIKRKGETIILYGWYQCSQCGAIIGEPTNYCSECGARMEVDG